MKHFEKVISIQTSGKSDYDARLVTYIPDSYPKEHMDRIRPAVLILPGGGYAFTSEREAEPVALEFVRQGVCAFVLYYSVKPAYFPQALCETLESIRYIREHAKEWYIDENNISVCGFSAGGHLAASAGIFWNNECIDAYIGKEREGVRPNKLILSYPVITSGEFAHKASFMCLLGENNDKLMAFTSLEKQVHEQVPPTFIWHTYEDQAVPVQNTMLFANALLQYKVPLELHIYPRGGHGLSLGNYLVNQNLEYGTKHMSSEWIEQSIRFIFD